MIVEVKVLAKDQDPWSVIEEFAEHHGVELVYSEDDVSDTCILYTETEESSVVESKATSYNDGKKYTIVVRKHDSSQSTKAENVILAALQLSFGLKLVIADCPEKREPSEEFLVYIE